MNTNKLLKKFLPRFILNSFKIMRLLYWLRYKIVIIPRLKKQLSGQVNGHDFIDEFKGKKILFPLIETSHFQYYQLAILAKSLQLRGAKIKVIVCGQSLDGCEIKSVRNEQDIDPCWRCRFNEKEVLPLFGLEVLKLNQILTKEEVNSFGNEARYLINADVKDIIRNGISLYQSIEDSIVRYFFGATPENTQYVNAVREAHTKTALMSIEVARRIDSEWMPTTVISNMSCYSAWDSYYRYYSSSNDRYCHISRSAFNFNSIIYNSFDLFPATKRFNNYVKRRKDSRLEDFELKELRAFIGNRVAGDADLFVENNYFSASKKIVKIKDALKYDETKRNIFLFSNLYWDVGLSDRSGLFPGVLDWIVGTIEIVKKDKNCHLYIKPHPAEVFGTAGSLKGVAQFVKEKYPGGVSNLTIIEPELKFNTYQLFPLINVGVIFTGTLGLEMMLAGIPVISTGKTSHNGFNLAAEPVTLSEYSQYLLGKVEFKGVSKDLLELFSYFYFIRTQIPWRLTKQVYSDDFDGFLIKSLDDLQFGRDPLLDHLCNCIVDSENTFPESWPKLEHM
jgi:hypothetical protein